MSWSDDIRCLYCDGRLPLYRKITNGQFCSTAHRKAYWKEQERLAVERLHQTHDTIRAYRPTANLDVESILGRLPEVEPELPAPMIEERPLWIALVNAGELPVAGFAVNPLSAKPCRPQDTVFGDAAFGDTVFGDSVQPLDDSRRVRRPFNVYRAVDCGFECADAVAQEVRPAAPDRHHPTDLVPINVAVYPLSRVKCEIQPVFEQIELVEEEIPPFAGLVALARPALHESWSTVGGATPLEITIRAQLPLDEVIVRVALVPVELLHAGMRQLPMDQIALVPRSWIDHLRALDLCTGAEAPLFTLSTPPTCPRLRLAAGRRYAVATQENAAGTKKSAGNLPPAPQQVSLPRRCTPVNAAPRAQQGPDPAGLVALPMLARAADAPIAMHRGSRAFARAEASRPEPVRPRGRFEPINLKPIHPIADLTIAPPEWESQREHAHFGHLLDFWNRAPRGLKMLMVTMPFLLALAMYPGLPEVRVAAPAKAAAIRRDVKRAWNAQVVSMKQSVADRAAVALDEDFRSGLDDWASRSDAPTEWSFDATGFVRPGPLAFYRPTMALTDYQLQFLGMIDKKALSWVARAADFSNFYVIKLVVLKGGPLPTIGVTRYAVVNGKADSRMDRIAPIDAREDMLYRVRLDVHGDDFALTVQGQLVDAWSEPRLNHGGIGFFTARGEESRLRWVQVTHQYDMLGRLCAYLAPYNVTQPSSGITQASTGSWQQ
jgi:hypothetical protein